MEASDREAAARVANAGEYAIFCVRRQSRFLHPPNREINFREGSAKMDVPFPGRKPLLFPAPGVAELRVFLSDAVRKCCMWTGKRGCGTGQAHRYTPARTHLAVQPRKCPLNRSKSGKQTHKVNYLKFSAAKRVRACVRASERAGGRADVWAGRRNVEPPPGSRPDRPCV